MNCVPPVTPHCISCGDAIHDDGAEQTEAWLSSLCPECYDAQEAGLSKYEESWQTEADAIASYDHDNADRSREYEPRGAF